MGRVTATVLFTDLVDSTELRGRLGEGAADELLRKHDQLLAQAVEANSGRVVKGLGDGIMATFPGASDAVAAAVAVQQAVDRLNRSGKTPLPLEVRVGLSAGDVSFEDDDVHGTPVIESSRLCAVAGGGEIVASDIVRWLAGGDAPERFAPLGSLELKGLAAPVPAVRVGWEPVPVSTIPMPALLTDIGRMFVGRDAELERLQQLWKEAAAGERRVALLAGEPGVGKTRLAAELATRVHNHGGMVLAGRCDEDLGVPYQPFVEALRHFIDHVPPKGLEERLGRYGGELARLVPDLGELVPALSAPLRSDPETERYRLFDAVASWLSAVSKDDPVLVVLDDLQWAAKPTVLLLRHIIRVAPAMRVLVVATYRDTDLGPDEPLTELLADLRRSGIVERLSLVGLDSAAVAAFMEEAAGHELDEAGVRLAHAIQEETAGNVFFVGEVVRHLAESGLIEQREGRWGTDLPLDEVGMPESVKDVVGRRLARLSGETNGVLRMAAVVGAEFDLGVLQAAGSLNEEMFLSCLDEAASARLILVGTDVGRYRFAHALVRDAIYHQLSPARRASLHRKVAQAIELLHAARLDDQLPALAHHWGRAGTTGDTVRAVDYAVRAGDRAMAQLAFEAAASHYEQALGAMDASDRSDGLRSKLLLALGGAQVRCGDGRAGEAYRSAAELARTTGDAETLARAAVGLADLWAFSSSVDDTRIGLLEEARNALADVTSPITAQILARQATELYTVPGSWERRGRLSAESIEVARQLGDPLTLAFSLHARNYTLWAPGGAEERLARGREIVDLAHRGGDSELALQGHAWCQIALLELGDVDGLDAELEAYARLADELRQPRYRWYATTRRAMRALLAGDLCRGEQLVREARHLGREAAEPDAENVFSTQMFVVWEDRPSREGLAVFEAACQAAAGALHGESPLVRGLRLMRLLLMVDTADNAKAEQELAGLLKPAIDDLDPTYYGMGWSIMAVLLSTAAARLSAADASAALYELLAPYAGLVVQNCGAVAFHGSYSHHLGTLATTLGRWGEADEHFTDAAKQHEDMGARGYLARTRLEWGRMLLTRRRPGDADRALELVGQALTTARDLGLANVERRSSALLKEGP